MSVLKKCSTHAQFGQYSIKGIKMLKMTSEIVLAQLILVWQQGMARVHFIPHSCHIHRKSVIVKENHLLS